MLNSLPFGYLSLKLLISVLVMRIGHYKVNQSSARH